MNKLKFGLVFVFIVAGVAGFIYLSESPMVVRVLSILAGFLLAVITARFTIQGQEFYVFCKESTEETKKVVIIIIQLQKRTEPSTSLTNATATSVCLNEINKQTKEVSS